MKLRRSITTAAFVAAILIFAIWWSRSDRPADVVIGSKKFTESVLLGHIATDLLRQTGVVAKHQEELGGTRILWDALLAGDIDAYPEYTGTITQELLPAALGDDPTALAAALQKIGVGMSGPIGFNNTYALGMREDRAAALSIRTVSDLQAHPRLRFGFSNEFLERKDCWPALRARYGLPHTNVTGLDHDLAYRAMGSGEIDVTDLYSTDAEIAFYKLRVLEDDLKLFPEYQAVFLYRLDLRDREPAAVTAIESMASTIDAPRMVALNAMAKNDRVPERKVAADFVAATFGGSGGAALRTRTDEIVSRTIEHLDLVGRSLSMAILLGVPVGIFAARCRVAGQIIIGVVAAIYTIPSLALLVFMIPLLGIGKTPAVAALFLYSLLPIVRNTHAGLTGIPQPLRESATALGLSKRTRLLRIDLPLAGASILAGIKTAAVINVGTATIGALIGAGGYGQPILTGIRLADNGLILLGAVPAAVMALAIQGVFEVVEWWWLRRVR